MRAASRRKPGWTVAATAAAATTPSSPDHTIIMQRPLDAQAIPFVSVSGRGDFDKYAWMPDTGRMEPHITSYSMTCKKKKAHNAQCPFHDL